MNFDIAERKSAIILAAVAVVQGAWVLWNLRLDGWRFVHYLGFASGQSGNLLGWAAAAFVAIIYVVVSARRLPSVRKHLVRPSFLKLLALAVAIAAGILEEVMFRRWTMNWLMAHGQGAIVQVLGSGLFFGAAHGIWGLMGKSIRVAIGATVATGLLGVLLALVFLLAGRSLAPCIVAHFFITLLIEPGLVLAATRGEMGLRR
ncbi:MAG: CPBP family intramembrane metalloprotease [Chthoniobacterales bacterium]|nr:CPBP family intramembrane metalloprotease [Chthoniobacterales bacterium]